MESKTLAVITVFSALSIFLVLSPAKFPAPYAPFLKYQIWEIPIVVAFLLYGPLVGVVISLVNTFVLLVVFPGELPAGPLYNLAAVLSTLLGIYIMHQLLTKHFGGTWKKLFIPSTALGMVLRVALMSIVNVIFLPYPYPVGFQMPVEAVIAILPLVGVFNATLVLYTIPIGYFLARSISYGTKIPWWTPRAQSPEVK